MYLRIKNNYWDFKYEVWEWDLSIGLKSKAVVIGKNLNYRQAKVVAKHYPYGSLRRILES